MTTKINGVTVIMPDGFDLEEAMEYVKLQKEKYPRLHTLTIKPDGEEVDLIADDRNPFDRLRRITGYLVGTTERWNNAKRAELNDRVKHTLDA